MILFFSAPGHVKSQAESLRSPLMYKLSKYGHAGALSACSPCLSDFFIGADRGEDSRLLPENLQFSFRSGSRV